MQRADLASKDGGRRRVVELVVNEDEDGDKEMDGYWLSSIFSIWDLEIYL